MKEPFEISRTTLDSGMKVVTATRSGLSVFFSNLVLHGGSIYDPHGKNGVAELVSRFLEKDTVNFKREEIAGFIESLGGWISSSSGKYIQQVKTGILSNFAHHAVSMMAEMVKNPLFDDAELSIEKQKLISEYRETLTIPSEVLSYAFNLMLYKGHPLGFPSSGVVETIQNIELDDLDSFHRNYFCPSNSMLFAVSDLPHSSVVEMVENAFGDWECNSGPQFPSLPDVRPIRGRRALIVDMAVSQVFVLLGHHAPLRNNPNFPELMAIDFVIGGGNMLSRLMREIRVKRGLAYSAASMLRGGLKFPGIFAVNTETKVETGNEVMRLIVEILRDVHENGISRPELEAAVSFFQGAIPRMTESSRQVLSALVNTDLFGLEDFYWLKDVDKISKLSVDEVASAAKNHLKPDDFVAVVVADASKFDLNVKGVKFDDVKVVSPEIFETLDILEG